MKILKFLVEAPVILTTSRFFNRIELLVARRWDMGSLVKACMQLQYTLNISKKKLLLTYMWIICIRFQMYWRLSYFLSNNLNWVISSKTKKIADICDSLPSLTYSVDFKLSLFVVRIFVWIGAVHKQLVFDLNSDDTATINNPVEKLIHQN